MQTSVSLDQVPFAHATDGTTVWNTCTQRVKLAIVDIYRSARFAPFFLFLSSFTKTSRDGKRSREIEGTMPSLRHTGYPLKIIHLLSSHFNCLFLHTTTKTKQKENRVSPWMARRIFFFFRKGNCSNHSHSWHPPPLCITFSWAGGVGGFPLAWSNRPVESERGWDHQTQTTTEEDRHTQRERSPIYPAEREMGFSYPTKPGRIPPIQTKFNRSLTKRKTGGRDRGADGKREHVKRYSHH